jgi:glutamyl-tRNA synthetase
MERRVRVRFAPSPTGPLHIGGVRTALYNYLFAKKHGGDCLIRIEDTDQNRYVPGAEQYILDSLAWVGLTFDEGPHVGGPYAPYRQSDRMHIYKEYAEKLVKSGHAYLAFDTTEELSAMRQKLEAARMPAKYDAASRMSMKNSLTLSEDEVNKRIANGDPYVIRIKLPRKEEVRFQDVIRGWVVVHSTQMDDKVLLKNDGLPTYHLANVVDDYLMKITHVIRGEEWLPSAPLHVMLYKYLGWEAEMPAFAHLPLILKPEGVGKLSKRDGDQMGFPVFPIEWKDPDSGEISKGYRESGYQAAAVINLLALLGWHPSDNREIFSLEELSKEFSLDRVSKSGAKFDIQKAKWFNHQYLMELSDEALLEQLKSHVQTDRDDAYLLKVISLIKEKVNFSSEMAEIGHYFLADPKMFDDKVVKKKWKGEVPATINELANGLDPLKDWKADAIQKTFENLAEQKGMSPGSIMQPLRLAVSGEGGGPPIFEMLELLGQATVIRRLRYAVANLRGESQEV